MAWTAYIDGGSRGNPGPAAAGVQLLDDQGRVVFSGGFLLGHQTNNAAEYNGLIHALELLSQAGADRVDVVSDSELMVRQINGQYQVRSSQLRPLFDRARRLLQEFAAWSIRHVDREENSQADRLANDAMDAGHDVISRDELSLLSRESPPTPSDDLLAKPRERSEANPQNISHPSVRVTVQESPPAGICPANMRRGESFVFDARTPDPLCVFACAGVIESVLKLQQAASSATATAACQKSGCTAIFDLERKSE